MERVIGFEPTTSCLASTHSGRLSYYHERTAVRTAAAPRSALWLSYRPCGGPGSDRQLRPTYRGVGDGDRTRDRPVHNRRLYH